MSDNLRAIFSPRSVAIIGATDRDMSINKRLLTNIVFNNFQGPVYPINPKRAVIHGIPAYKSVEDVPGPVDLAILLIPVHKTPEIIESCGRKGVKGLVIITAGFREIGGEGIEREKKLHEQCKKYGIRFIGPNCFGVINTNPAVRLNGTFSANNPLPGVAAFMSQSGALGEVLMDRANQVGLGISRFASLGNKTDVSAVDLIELWENDDDVKLYLLYIESIGHGRRFAEMSRRILVKKPLVALKAGRTERGALAAASHTGALANERLADEALFRQFGVIQVNNLDEMFHTAYALLNQPLPKGPGIGVVTNAGGPGILVTDACITAGLEVPELSSQVQDKLNNQLRIECSTHNPIDVIASGGPEEYRVALEAVMEADNIHSIIVVFVPNVVMDALETAKVIREFSDRKQKPIHVVPMIKGHIHGEEAEACLKEGGIPLYSFPYQVAKVIDSTLFYREWKEHTAKQELVCNVSIEKRNKALQVITKCKNETRVELTDTEARKLLSSYDIPIVETADASTISELSQAAERVGYPVVLKSNHPGLLHKTDIGGVELNITNAEELKKAKKRIEDKIFKTKQIKVNNFTLQPMVLGGHELILGVRFMSAYGHLIMFGLGGIFVELTKAVTFGIAPLTRTDALSMIEQSPAHKLLTGFRGKSGSDIEIIVDTLCNLSFLAFEHPEIAEIDINPFLVFDKSSKNVALDQLIVLKNDSEK